MKRLHGPFEPVPRARRGDRRERLKDGVRMGTCGCSICERRREKGAEPYGLPEEKLWVRLPEHDGQPASQRPVYLCDVTPTTGD